MLSFENTSLWKAAFGKMDGKQHNEKKAEYRQAFLSFHDRAKQLAGEIHRDQPSFTVHDITHIDALWEIASLIIAEEFPMTPTEGFVFGGALLVHDLAMTLAAYPKGIAELKSEPEYRRLTRNQRFRPYPKKRMKQFKDDFKKLRVIKDDSGKIVGRGCLLA